MSSDELFIPFKFKTTVQLSPVEVHGNINDRIKEKLKAQFEGICSRFGFVQPNSIDVVRRSAGILLKAHFNGHVKFEVHCKARVCNPVNGMVLSGTVLKENHMGILAECKIDVDGRAVPVLDVIIPYRTAGIQSDVDLAEYKIGDQIYFQVVGKRSQVNDRKISVIGRGVAARNADPRMSVTDVDDVEDDREERDDDYFEDLEDLELRGGDDEEKLEGDGDGEGDGEGEADGETEGREATGEEGELARGDDESEEETEEDSDDDLEDFDDEGDDDVSDVEDDPGSDDD